MWGSASIVYLKEYCYVFQCEGIRQFGQTGFIGDVAHSPRLVEVLKKEQRLFSAKGIARPEQKSKFHEGFVILTNLTYKHSTFMLAHFALYTHA